LQKNIKQNDQPMKTPIRFFIRLLCAAFASVQMVDAAIIQVTNGNDSGPGTLRHALASAENGDTIQLFPNYTPGMEVVLTSGELLVHKNVSITSVHRSVHVPVRRSAGTPAFRIFHIARGTTVNISGLIITNGSNDGGGIWNDHATLEINHCIVRGNSGGGIFNDNLRSPKGDAILTINHCTISGNTHTDFIGGRGGGITSGNDTNAEGSSTVAINYSTITGNSTNGKGGGIYNACSNEGSSATLRIHNCTISGNSVTGSVSDRGRGGGIYAEGDFSKVFVINSTLSSNSAYQQGGGIWNAGGTLDISHSTLADNSAPFGGGIYGNCRIGNTILKTGARGPNLHGNGVVSIGYNLSNDNGSGALTAPGDQINTHPMLGPLQDNGGPTLTHALLTGSPAINKGDPNFTPPPEFDQRGAGYPRVMNGRLDIGSVEVQN
jgi:hypothetical protein